MNKSIMITVDEQEFEIKKMAVGQFAQLMLAVEKLPSILMENFNLEEIDNLDINMLLTKLPPLLASSQEELFKVISVASGLSVNDIRKLDFVEILDVIIAILELNKFKAIVNKIKNLGQVLQNLK